MSADTHQGSEAQTRNRIITAALAEFTRFGYKGCSTRAIAERAGVNEVTLFRHFGTKVQLLRATIAYTFDGMVVPQDLEPYLQLTCRDGLTRLLSEYMDQISGISDILTLGFSESFGQPDIIEPLKRFVWQMRGVFLRYMEGQCACGRMREADFPVVAHTMMVSAHSLPLARRRFPEQMATQLTDERLVAGLVDMLVRAYSLDEE